MSHVHVAGRCCRKTFFEGRVSNIDSAVLGAPAFLSGLTDADINIVKSQVAKRLAPEIAATKDATLKALQETEAGWRAAIGQISNRGGLGRPHDGMVRAATAADVA